MSATVWPEAPANFVLRKSGAHALYVAESLENELRLRKLDAWDTWDRALAAGSRSSGRGKTAFVGGASAPRWRLKRMRRGGLLARYWRDWYPSSRRLVAALTASEQARARGIPTARPVALIVEAGWGGFARGAMALEEIEGSEDLARRTIRGAVTREELSASMRVVRCMHERGIHHADLNLGNVLLRPNSRGGSDAFVIDFDRAVLGSVPRPFSDRQGALRRLARSCAKLTGSPGPTGPESEDLWYDLYAGDDADLALRLAQGRSVGRFVLALHRVGRRR